MTPNIPEENLKLGLCPITGSIIYYKLNQKFPVISKMPQLSTPQYYDSNLSVIKIPENMRDLPIF